MQTKNILYDGSSEPLPEQVYLRAGPLSVIFENGDLRTIRLGEHEILRRLYVAIRDRNWGTVPPLFSNLRIERGVDYFHITFDAENRQGEIHFSWRGAITGAADGTITYTLGGEAQTAFWKNRIGFCVLHPAGLAGTACEIEHVDGSKSVAVLPATISREQPVPPFGDLRAITYEVEEGVRAEVRMEGDIFEMEDQRNWTDASYKIFGTPLRIPYPAQMRKGERVRQSVTMRLYGSAHSQNYRAGHDSVGSPVVIRVVANSEAERPLPEIGLGFAHQGKPLSERAAERLKRLKPGHLRVDIMATEPNFAARLRMAAEQAWTFGANLHVALIFDPADAGSFQWLTEVGRSAADLPARVAVWLIYPALELFTGGTPVREAVEMARSALGGAADEALFAAGTNTDLIFLQRSLPPLEQIDAVCFAINPQVHAFDNQSVIETLQAQPDAVRTAKELAEGLPVLVSPVTLKPRHNPYATGPAPVTPEGELPPQVDPRQASLLGAVWTVGSIRAMAVGGAGSVTYYETTGWRGVMLEADDAPYAKFPANPGEVFPLYHILATVAQWAGGVSLPVQSSDWLKVGALAMRQGERLCLLLVNYTLEAQEVIVRGLPEGEAQVRWLDETNARFAMKDPEGYRGSEGEPARISGGEMAVTLLPYGVRRLICTIPGV